MFIPAYNAAKTLPAVLSRLSQDDWRIIGHVFVVDDGSKDKTSSSVAKLSSLNPKISLFSLPENKGYGAAVNKGIELCRTLDPDFCVCLHADGQYPPEKIREFTDIMAEQRIDILQGSRHKDGTALRGNMPVYKYIFGKILVLLENKVFDLNMTDYHSGFLFYSRRALAEIPFQQLSSSFDFDLEVIASARARNLKIDELGIPTRYGDEESHLNPITYGLRVLRVLFRYKRGYYHRKSNGMDSPRNPQSDRGF